MAAGPTTIFDKSALECLSLDEAALFGHFYQIVITPIFYIEALADLEKSFDDGREPERVVARAAEKMGGMGPRPNAEHRRMCLAELLGVQSIPLLGFPAIAGGRHVRDGNRRGVVFRQAPEIDALSRWQRGEFKNVERMYAKAWRSALTQIDLEQTYRTFKPYADGFPRPKSLAETKDLATSILAAPAGAESALAFALNTVGIDAAHFGPILERWKSAGSPPLPLFAPFTAHVATVDLFFGMALAYEQIYRGRPTNRVDIGYLYYLPFCMVFVSQDRLHRQTAPLFLGEHQSFVWGDDLKADLHRIDAALSKLPEATLRAGLIRCVNKPPSEGALTFGLWQLRSKTPGPGPVPGMSSRAAAAGDHFASEEMNSSTADSPALDSAKERSIIEEVKRISQAPATDEVFDIKDADFVTFEQLVSRRVGKWQLFPPETEGDSLPPFA
jgi:hypothetical protein